MKLIVLSQILQKFKKIFKHRSDDPQYIEDEFQKFRCEIYRWARHREEKFLESWCKEAHVDTPVGYHFDYCKGFTIYTDHPGYLIGKEGKLIHKYIGKMRKEFGVKDAGIELIEVRTGFANYRKK